MDDGTLVATDSPMLSAPNRLETSLLPHGSGRVVCVDLDGTLIAADLLWESFVELLKQRPFQALILLLGALRGRARFKRRVARLVPIDPSALPYREDLLDELRELHRRGAWLVLATSSDESYARAVGAHLEIFTDVVASDGRVNLSGRSKAAALVDRYGENGFDYIGNDWADMPVWRAASKATAVAASPRLGRFVTTHRVIDRMHSTAPGTLRSTVQAMRPYQWVKNALVFVPAIGAHEFSRLDPWLFSALAFLVFSLSASAVYVLNDIADIRTDRLHPRKRSRPFAAGHLSVPFGLAAATALLAAAFSVCVAALSWQVALVVVTYLVATTSYSLVLKRTPVVDVFTLTGLYVLRIVGGGIATGIPLSSWLLAFALFLFLSLAFVKRYAELITTNGWIAGRGYGPDDAMWMHAIGTSAGYMAVLVLALYINAPEIAVLYTRPRILWFMCPLFLFWLTRLWFRAGRRVVHDDPVMEALRDPATYVIGGAALVIVLAAV
jgi:4-hydroxybenzoate polyprenyltransferase